MRGRKPTPTPLKILHGNPGKRPLPTDEPQPRQGDVTCPEHLDEEAKKEWARMSAELEPLGLLTVVDRAALAAYCQLYSQSIALGDLVKKLGAALFDNSTTPPTPYPNPFIAALNRTLKTMHAFISEFGLSPASRTRIHVAPQKKIGIMQRDRTA